MRPFAVRMAAVARATGSAHDVVLKDYALSYLLAAIYSNAEFGSALAFKGGTALRKCFLRGYRFSEDLDFTLREEWTEERVEAALELARVEAGRLTSVYGRFEFELERIRHREEHPLGQLDFRVRVGYPTGPSLPIKVEITQEEGIVLPLISLSLIHLFEEEELPAAIQCYSLEEIVLEKLRAFLQARRYLEQREWLNRARDLYDLAELWRQDQIQIEWRRLRGPLEEKARARGVSFDGPDDFRDPRVLRAYQQQWEPRLRGSVRELPAFEVARAAFDELLAAIFE